MSDWKRKPAPRESYMLPGGEMTTDAELYCKAWKELARPLCELMGWTLFTFDPDLGFGGGPYGNGRSCPVGLAMAFYRLATGKEFQP